MTREEDRKARIAILEAMKLVASLGYMEDAKELGRSAKAVANRIATKDYSQEDAWRQRERDILKP